MNILSLDKPVDEEDDDSLLLDFIKDPNTPDPAEVSSFIILKEQLEEVLNALTPREKDVLKLRYGFGDGDELAEINLSDAPNFFDLQEEADFVAFVREIIFAPPDKIFVRTYNYVGDKEKLHAHLKTLATQIKIFCVRPEEVKFGFEHRDDFT